MAIPNQSPNSSIPGFLQPLGPPWPDGQINPGDPLEDYLQQWVAGVAYMEETLVRPRWQLVPPNLPEVGTDWCAVGIAERRPLGFVPAALNFPAFGIQQLQRHEEFELLCSFYGPRADVYASHLHDGAPLWQNRSPLRSVGMALIELHAATRVPELVKEQYLNRVDKPVTFRRIIRKNYPVLTIVAVRGLITADDPYQVPFRVGEPADTTLDAPKDGAAYGIERQRWTPARPV